MNWLCSMHLERLSQEHDIGADLRQEMVVALTSDADNTSWHDRALCEPRACSLNTEIESDDQLQALSYYVNVGVKVTGVSV